jgi:magnesium chelatase family protein
LLSQKIDGFSDLLFFARIMSVRLYSATTFGIEAYQVSVEVQIVGLTNRFSIVGLPDGAVRESRHRVRCAIESSGFSFPQGDIIVNLGPAQVPKFGAQLDLAIAIGVLCVDGSLNPSLVVNVCGLGELAFDGSVRPIGGIISASDVSRKSKLKTLIVPRWNEEEASLVSGIEAVCVGSLSEAIEVLRGNIESKILKTKKRIPNASTLPNFDDVTRQHAAKRALTISAAGGHNLLMTGPPGSGKSMLAKRLISILPSLEESEAMEVFKIHSASNSLGQNNHRFSLARPFRAPHHSSSLVGLVGGGSHPKPGEISLAHRGVLFLDELPEFRRDVLDALRQPLETGNIEVCRAKYSVVMPARFMMIAAMNPCPCGYFGSSQGCSCAIAAVQRYRNRISGPILDRIDIHVLVDNIPVTEITHRSDVGETKQMIERVKTARKMQLQRFGVSSRYNSELSISEVRKYCRLGDAAQGIVEKFSAKFRITGRGYVRILKLSRTIADLAGLENISEEHLLEALQYRPKLEIY